jgi:hypothetical protein
MDQMLAYGGSCEMTASATRTRSATGFIAPGDAKKHNRVIGQHEGSDDHVPHQIPTFQCADS